MDEQKEKEVKETPDNTDEGNKSTTTPLIDDANIAAKRMEEANKEKKELLDREEELMAKRALGGELEAGKGSEKKEETNQEYVDKMRSNGWKANA
jgi:hypothetical protein